MSRFGIFIIVLLALCSLSYASFSNGSLNADIYGTVKYSGFDNGIYQIEFEDNGSLVSPILFYGDGGWDRGDSNGYYLQYDSGGLLLTLLNNTYYLTYPCDVYNNVNYYEFVVTNSDGLVSGLRIDYPGIVYNEGATSGNGSWYCVSDDWHTDFVISGTIGLFGSFSADSTFEVSYGYYDGSSSGGNPAPCVPAPGAVVLAGFGTTLAGYFKRQINHI